MKFPYIIAALLMVIIMNLPLAAQEAKPASDTDFGNIHFIKYQGKNWLEISGTKLRMPILGPWNKAHLENRANRTTFFYLLPPFAKKNDYDTYAFEFSLVSQKKTPELYKKMTEQMPPLDKLAIRACDQVDCDVDFISDKDPNYKVMQCKTNKNQAFCTVRIYKFPEHHALLMISFVAHKPMPPHFLENAKKMMQALKIQ